MSITKVRGKELVNIELFQGLAGKVLYINDYRITPYKPIGVMTTAWKGLVEKSDLISSLKLITKELEGQS